MILHVLHAVAATVLLLMLVLVLVLHIQTLNVCSFAFWLFSLHNKFNKHLRTLNSLTLFTEHTYKNTNTHTPMPPPSPPTTTSWIILQSNHPRDDVNTHIHTTSATTIAIDPIHTNTHTWQTTNQVQSATLMVANTTVIKHKYERWYRALLVLHPV